MTISAIIFIILFVQTPIFGDEADDEKILRSIEDTYTDYSVAIMTGEFKKAYALLTSSIQKRISYDNFVKANQMAMKSFLLKASQLSNLRARGKYAAARAITFIDFLPKKEGDQVLNGKIEAPIFFIKEKNIWKLATGTDEDIEEFLKLNPKAREIMVPVKTRLYYKQKGYWIAFDYNVKEDQKLTIPL